MVISSCSGLRKRMPACVVWHGFVLIFESSARLTLARYTLESMLVFNLIYLTSGYWQVQVDPNDQEKTSFVTPLSLYQPTWMCMYKCVSLNIPCNLAGKHLLDGTVLPSAETAHTRMPTQRECDTQSCMNVYFTCACLVHTTYNCITVQGTVQYKIHVYVVRDRWRWVLHTCTMYTLYNCAICFVHLTCTEL